MFFVHHKQNNSKIFKSDTEVYFKMYLFLFVLPVFRSIQGKMLISMTRKDCSTAHGSWVMPWFGFKNKMCLNMFLRCN